MFEHILVPLDGSPLAEGVLPHVVAAARTSESQAFEPRVTLLRVLERPSATSLNRAIDPLDWGFIKAEAKAYLEEATARLRQVGVQTDNELLEGQAAQRIIDCAHEHHVSLIILSSHGRSGLSGWNVSSAVQKIILHAPMPVLIVRAFHPQTRELTGVNYRRILVPLDGSLRAESALPLASTLAQAHQAQLLLAHVSCRPAMPRHTLPTQEDVALANRLMERNRAEAASYVERLQTRLPMEAHIRLLEGDSAAAELDELVEREEVDLVVLTAHGYTGRSKWPYGSVALSILAYGSTSLLLVQDLCPEELAATWAAASATEHKGH